MEKRIALCFCLLAIVCADTVAQTSRHRAVRSGLSSSDALIDTALANGRIDEETALTYRVYAAFDDCRLPFEFRGDDSSVIGVPPVETKLVSPDGVTIHDVHSVALDAAGKAQWTLVTSPP